MNIEKSRFIKDNYHNYSYNQKILKEIPQEASFDNSKNASDAITNISKAGIAIQDSPVFQGRKIIIPKERLVEVLALGLTLGEMCELLGGISIPKLKSSLKENDLEFIPPTNHGITDRITKEQFDEVYNMAGSPKEKAKELGVSQATYYKLARKFGYQKLKIKRKSGVDIDKITKEQFAEIHFNPNMNHLEKRRALGISEVKYYKLSDRFGLKSSFARKLKRSKEITEEEFRAIAESDIPLDEKLKQLDLPRGSYYKLMAKFGILTEMQKQQQKLDSITEEEFQSVFEMEIPNAEKCKLLEISESQFKRLAKKFGLKSKLQLEREHAQSITKERFEAVFNLPVLEKDKQAILGINHITYRKLAFKFGLQKEGAGGRLKNLTEKEFRKIFEMDIPLAEKLKLLGCKNANTYYILMARFGIPSRVQLFESHLSTFTKEQVEEILNSELPEKEKLEKAGLTSSAYKRLLHKYGLLTRYQRAYIVNQNITYKQLQTAIKNNKTIKSVCNELNISYTNFYKLVRKYNLNYRTIIERNQTKEGGRSSYANFSTDKLQERLFVLHTNEKISGDENISDIIEFLIQQDEYPLQKKSAIIDFIRQLDNLETDIGKKEDILNSDSFKDINAWMNAYYEPYELRTKMELLQETITNAHLYHLQDVCQKYNPKEGDLYNPERIEASREILALTEKYIDSDELSQKERKDLANILTYFDKTESEILEAAKSYSTKFYNDNSPLHVQQIINILKMLDGKECDEDLTNDSKLFASLIGNLQITRDKAVELMVKLDNYFDTEEAQNYCLNDFCNVFNSGTVIENKIIDEYIQKIYINKDTVKESGESKVHQNFVSILDKKGKQKVWNSKVNINKAAFFRDTEKYMDSLAEGKTKRPGIKIFTLDNGDNIAEIKVSGFNGARMFAKLESLDDEIYIFNDFAPKGFHTNVKR